jgi:hypothetical protein
LFEILLETLFDILFESLFDSLLESLLDSLFETLFESLFESLFDSLLETTGVTVLLLVPLAMIAFLVAVMLLIKDFFSTLMVSPKALCPEILIGPNPDLSKPSARDAPNSILYRSCRFTVFSSRYGETAKQQKA